MHIVHPEIETYSENHSSPPSDILNDIERATHLRCIYPRMLSGKLQGRLLSMISKMIRPEKILEIGTFTGYSAICLSEGLTEGGKITTIEVNEELMDQNAEYFNKANLQDVIEVIYGDAMEIIPGLADDFDLVFIDADKFNYSGYFDMVINKVKLGGFIIADNVLWSGKVIQANPSKTDKDTLAIMEFNKKIQEDDRVENVLMPVRDGMTIMVRVK